MYIWRREGTENSATHFTFHRCNRNNKVAAVMTPVRSFVLPLARSCARPAGVGFDE